MPPFYDLIPKYFPDLSAKQLSRFSQLWEFYQSWNSKINLISRKDIDELYIRHVLHALAIAKVIRPNPHIKILDVGTGGGFPGIPLSIFFEEVEFIMVDSIGKKIKVVNEAIRELQLENAIALQSRAEEIKDRYDLVVSRAVTQLDRFIPWVQNKIIPGNSSGMQNGIIYLKGGDLTKELDALKRQYVITEISDYFEEPFFQTKRVIHIF